MVPKVIAADKGLSYMKGNLGPKIVAPHLDLNSPIPYKKEKILNNKYKIGIKSK